MELNPQMDGQKMVFQFRFLASFYMVQELNLYNRMKKGDECDLKLAKKRYSEINNVMSHILLTFKVFNVIFAVPRYTALLNRVE